MKRRLSTVLAIILTGFVSIGCLAEEDHEFFESGDYEYYINDEGTVTISGWNGSSESIVIPDEINGKITTTIGKEAFKSNSKLCSVEIPDSVKMIETGAFSYCSKLNRIIVSPDNENYAVIDNVLFEKKDKELVCYPGGLSVSEYCIPAGILLIGEAAFSGCGDICNIELPDSVTAIGENAFASCYNLNSITIPDSVTTIDAGAFTGCSSLENIELPDSVDKIEDGLFANCIRLSGLEVSDAVTTIGEGAFSGCANIRDIELPDSVTSIGDHAFYGCYNLISAVVPASVITIGRGAFDTGFDLTLTVDKDSYAKQYAEENGIPYTYPDANDWLND